MTQHDMPTWELVLRLVAGVLLIAGNALFVLTEFALTRARHVGEESFQDSAALRRAWKMTDELEIYLTSCQLGISSTSVLLGVLAEPGVTALIRPLGELVGLEGGALQTTSVVVAIVLLNLIHKIWGEQAPTYFGVEEPVLAAKIGAPLLYVWTKALYPLVMAGDGIAKWTLRLFGIKVTRSWVDEEEGGDGEADDDHDGERKTKSGGRHRGSYGDLRRAFNELMIESRVPADRREEVIGALEIDIVNTEAIMVPRDEMVALRRDDDIRTTFKRIGETKKVRYPLVGDDDDDVKGVVYTPILFEALDELLEGTKSLSELVVEPVWVSADLPIGELIDRFQDERQELALVHDDDHLVGLVTITDAFEYIAGEVEDPLDEPEDEGEEAA